MVVLHIRPLWAWSGPHATTYAPKRPVHSQKAHRQDAPSYASWMPADPADVIGIPVSRYAGVFYLVI